MGNPYEALPARTGYGPVNVVVDTPRGSRNKYKFDEQAQCFRLSRILSLGATFPHDFGAIPRTIAEDGDPLDVPVTSVNPAEPEHIDEMPSSRIQEIEHFFVSCNRAHGRQFRPMGQASPDEAERILCAAERRYENPPE